jgi:hypothetical protein
MHEKFLEVDDAARILKVTPFTMRRYLRVGIVKGVKVGKSWKIPEGALTTDALAVQSAPIVRGPGRPIIAHLALSDGTEEEQS